MNTAILFLVFNRPELTRKVMAAIREAQPPKLYVAADGPRACKNEEELCSQARLIATEVDWPCEVKTLFRAQNLGCRRAVSEAVDWFFRHEESGIILEDDCCPHPTFFPYCEEMLDRYATDERIMSIDGSSFHEQSHRLRESYCFSQYPIVWGWATWRRAWSFYDGEMSQWPKFRDTHCLRAWSEGDGAFENYWIDIFDRVSQGDIDTWDYQWLFSCWLHHGLSCHPTRNLVSNIGFGADGTHTFDSNNTLANRPAVEMEFPLIHPEHCARDVLADARTRACLCPPGTKTSYRSWTVSKAKRVLHLTSAKLR
jgi:hypothetical protein